MMSTKGQAIRVAMSEIPTLGRATQGVRIMRMAEGDTVASIGIVLPEEDDDTDGADSATKGKADKAAPVEAEAPVEESAEETEA